MSSAQMRVLDGRQVNDLEFVLGQDHNPYQVRVPGFGVLIIARRYADNAWRALLVQPDPHGGYSEESPKLEREAVVVDTGDVEVELLPGREGRGDRLVVVLTP